MFLQCTQIWKIIKRASKKASKRGKNDDGSGHHLIIGVPTSAHGSNLNPIAVQISVVFFFVSLFESERSTRRGI